MAPTTVVACTLSAHVACVMVLGVGSTVVEECPAIQVGLRRKDHLLNLESLFLC